MTCCGSDENVRPEGDHGRVEGIEGHVDDGRQIPVDAGLAERGAHAPRLERGDGGIARVAESLRGRRRQVAHARGQAHDEPAFVVGGDEEPAARAPQRQRLEIRRELSHLLGAA